MRHDLHLEHPVPTAPRLAAPALVEAVATARAAGTDRRPRALIRWAHALLADQLMMTTSFQKSGMVILHLARAVAPGLPVYFLDTGFHPDRCCRLNKVEPQRELLARHQGWIAGVRRDEAVTRGGAETLELSKAVC